MKRLSVPYCKICSYLQQFHETKFKGKCPFYVKLFYSEKIDFICETNVLAILFSFLTFVCLVHILIHYTLCNVAKHVPSLSRSLSPKSGHQCQRGIQQICKQEVNTTWNWVQNRQEILRDGTKNNGKYRFKIPKKERRKLTSSSEYCGRTNYSDLMS